MSETALFSEVWLMLELLLMVFRSYIWIMTLGSY